ncbi:MAG: hypothetical protein A3I75_04910 [Deltaproteobacteria bacterium RIFCSPLOWO2_02_FULL_50_16]|nr:MAG: hypothetical protein A3I75_04910 [Deltaproteobacteria bacterium RIFCSPLOWO2_02_FULL_50_16]OGQ67172.1 MAG: hypothetical protein A3F89_05220 [Deltaproteobacteria bacterium RIFCSPLOWO2_12_FULL_50_11]
MKKKLFLTVLFFLGALGLLLTLPVSSAAEEGHKEGRPTKGEEAVHSNAPSTGTQTKGKERALEVGKGEKKGLHKDQKNEKQKKEKPKKEEKIKKEAPKE